MFPRGKQKGPLLIFRPGSIKSASLSKREQDREPTFSPSLVLLPSSFFFFFFLSLRHSSPSFLYLFPSILGADSSAESLLSMELSIITTARLDKILWGIKDLESCLYSCIERFFELEIYIFATSFRWIHEESVRWIEAFVLFIIGKIFKRWRWDECEKSKFHCTNYSRKLFVLFDRYSIDVAEKLFSSLPFAIIYSTAFEKAVARIEMVGGLVT